MEKFTYRTLPVSSLDPAAPLSLRFAPAAVPESLQDSVARQGVVMPIWVTQAASPVIVAGYRRVAAARQAGLSTVPALILNETLAETELFLLAVLCNWQTPWEDLDRAVCLGKAEALGLDPKEITAAVLPALGLEPANYVFEEYLATAKLDAEVLQAIDEQKLPFRGARQLGRWPRRDQQQFVRLIAVHAALTTQELIKTVESLYGHRCQSGQDLEETLKLLGAETVLNHAVWDRRLKGEKFCQLLREQMHPALTAQEKKFAEALKAAPEFSGDFRVEAPAFFEDQGYQLRAKIKNKADLGRFCQLLEKRREWLNSLFDIML